MRVRKLWSPRSSFPSLHPLDESWRYSQTTSHMFVSAGCSTQWFSEQPLPCTLEPRKALGPPIEARKRWGLGLRPRSHMTRTTCSFIGSSRIFQKQFCRLSTNPYFYCWFENKLTATSSYFFFNLTRYIDLAKDKEQPKNLPIKIFTEDKKNCAPVSVFRTNNEIPCSWLRQNKRERDTETATETD